MGLVLPYRTNLQAAQRWSKMDTEEEVIARYNGRPITASKLLAELFEDTAPSEYCPPSQEPA